MPLDPKDRDRLEKLLNMLGSPVDGEIANAGRMIQKMATRYNVTPANLCLSNRIGSPSPFANPDVWKTDRAREDELNEFRRKHRASYGPRYDSSAAEAEIRRAQERREAGERMRRTEDAAAAEMARQRRQEEARAKSARRAKHFPGSYFGLLGRLKGIYDNHFDDLDTWKIDFIELVLTELKADRQMTIRQREMAKAVIKFTEDSEPLV